MSWLFESPVTIVALGIAVAFFLAVAWVQTGRNPFLYSIGGVVALVIVGLIIERSVETDREQVSKLIYTIAAELERNDADAVMKHVVSSRPELISRGRAEMAMHKFDSVEITAIHNVVAMPDHQPPQVEIEFNVVVGGTFMNGQMPLDTVHRFIRLTFWRDHDGQWRIADYDHAEPQAALFKRD